MHCAVILEIRIADCELRINLLLTLLPFSVQPFNTSDMKMPNHSPLATRHLPPAIRNIDILISPATLFTVAWLLMMIAIPIIGWVGDDYFEIGVIAGVLLQASAVLTILRQAWGWAAVGKLLGIILPVTWLLEFIGSHNGLPFGDYHYSDILQPQLGGVPLLIPVAWLMMLPVSWAVAQAIMCLPPFEKKRGIVGLIAQHYLFAGLSGLAMTAWDLFLDPQMVSWHYWIWENPGAYFGIPLLNFVGWWICATLITLGVMRVLQMQTLPVQPLLVIYGLVWGLQSVGQGFFWNQPGPAMIGFVAMGSLFGFALYGRLSHR